MSTPRVPLRRRLALVAFFLSTAALADAAPATVPTTAPIRLDVDDLRGWTPTPGDDARAALARAVQATDPAVGVEALLDALEGSVGADDEAARLRSARMARAPLVRDVARFFEAGVARRQGRFAESQAHFTALGIPEAVRCLGPFENTGGANFGVAPPMPLLEALQKGQTATGLDGVVAPQVVPRSPSGTFDVTDHFVAQRDLRAFCAVVVRAPRKQVVALRTGASGPLRISSGDTVLLDADDDHPLGFDQDTVLITLPAGESVLLVELSVLHNGGAFRLRLTAPEGGSADGLRFAADDATFARASRAARVAKAAGTVRHLRPAPTVIASQSVDEVRRANRLWRAFAAYDKRDRPDLLEAGLRRALQLSSSGDDRAERVRAEVRLATLLVERDPSEARDHLRAAEVEVHQARATGTPIAGAIEASVAVAFARLHEHQGNALEASRAWRQARTLAPGDASIVADQLQFERSRDVLGLAVDRAILAAAAQAPTDALRGLAASVLESHGDDVGARALVLATNNSLRLAVIDGEEAEARLGIAGDEGANAVITLARALLTRLETTPESHHLAERAALALRDAERLPATSPGRRGLPTAAAFVAERRHRYSQRPEPLRLDAQLHLIDGDRDGARARLIAAAARTPDDGELTRTIRHLDEGEDQLVARYFLPVDDARVAAARASPPADASLAGGYVASRTIAIRAFDNGQFTQVEERLVVITDARKAESMRVFQFGYSGGREDIEVLGAERITKDGRREPAERVVDRGQEGKENGAYSDARSKFIVLSAVEDGDVLWVRVRKEARGLQNLFGDFFGGIEVIQSRLPARDVRLILESPTSRPLSFGGRGLPTPQRTLPRDGGDVVTTTLTWPSVPALEGQPGMPPWLEEAVYVSFSTYQRWADLGVWYEALIADQLRLNDELRARAAAIKQVSSDRADLVRRLYEFVITETRYVGIELGIHGWKPYPVSEVYRRRFGDCKDKASLLVSLLREVGIEAHLALVRTIQLGHTGVDPPSMWAFNHAIAYVDELDLFLDGTAEHSGWHELPVMDQGAYALIVDGPGTRLVTIPVAPAEHNLNTSNYVLQLQSDGALAVRGEEHFRGARNSRERQTFADPATRRQTLERALSQGIPGTQVTAMDLNSTALDNEEIVYTFEAVLPRRANLTADGSMVMPVSLYPHGLVDSYAELDHRRFPLLIDHPWRTRNVMRYVLPPGMKVASLPAGGVVEGEHLRFVQRIERTDDGFIVDEDTAITSRRIPVEDYAAFREQALQADALMKRTIRLVPVGEPQ